MKTQISRDTFQAEKRYSGVYQQQGRMITDADWNELADVDKERLRLALSSVVGSGVPRDGGLRVEPDKTLTPGVVFAEGLEGVLQGTAPVSLLAQPDYPGAPALPTGECVLYADLWDRSVTSNEDPGLVDPGLHGADTATRTRTMVQVKWCPTSIDPEDPARNPAMGNGTLALQLRSIVASSDPCDPCAAQVKVDERVGNYVFRVEVHDVFVKGGHTHVVLKWSRDNGAEQFRVEEAPPDFSQGDWTYEFFDDVTEKHLGVDHAPTYVARRGKLADAYVVPTAPGAPKTYVRQWDGYCEIDITAPALVKGRDKGVALSTTASASAAGRVTIGTAFRASLELVEVELHFRARTFVPGDHWQAVVREATASPGDHVLGSSSHGELPRGVRHRYVRLAATGPTGTLVTPSDAERRKLGFPALTDLQASDVGFADHCPKLFAGAENVQAALDALCAIDASDIAYTIPGCGTPDAPTVRSLLPLPPGPSDVAAILDALLCNLRATSIPIDKTGLCADLAGPEIQTVNDALAALCNKNASTGCSVTVGEGGMYSTLSAAFDALGERTVLDVVICLLPGQQRLSTEQLVGKRTIKITGAGPRASSILLGGNLRLQADDIHLDDLSITFLSTGGQLVLDGEIVDVTACDFRRITGTTTTAPMIRLTEPESGGAEVFFQSCHLESRWVHVDHAIDRDALASPDLLGPSGAVAFGELLDAQTLGGKALDEASRKLAAEIVRLPLEQRVLWSRLVSNPVRGGEPIAANVAGPLLRPSRRKPGSLGQLVADLGTPGHIDAGSIARGVASFVLAWTRSGFTTALAFESVWVGGTLTDNVIEGDVRVNASSKAAIDLGMELTAVNINAPSPVNVGDGAARLALRNNRMNRFTFRADRADIATGTLTAPPDVFASLTASQNVLVASGSAFLGGLVDLQGNRFEGPDDARPAAVVLATQLVCVGNSGLTSEETIRRRAPTERLSANILTFQSIP